MIASFAYPDFAKKMSFSPKEIYRDPFDIVGFILAHIGIAMIVVGIIFENMISI